MSKELDYDTISNYFNITRRTVNYHLVRDGINYKKLYKDFNKSKTLRERKNHLYNLKDKHDEDVLDFIWECYIQKYEYEQDMERFKTNKRINREIGKGREL
jgi:hypothetical protein